MHDTLRTLTLLATATLASCWTPQHDEIAWRGHALTRSRGAADSVDRVGHSLTRAIEPRDEVTPASGDVLVYSIEVESPSSSYRRYLRLTVQPSDEKLHKYFNTTVTQSASDVEPRSKSFRSRVLPVRIELFDEHGEQIGESLAEDAMVDLLAMGFTEACEAYLRSDGKFETVDEAFEVALLDAPPMFSIGELLQSDDLLFDLAFDLVDTSLALTAIWAFGVRFTIEPKYDDVERVAAEGVTGRRGYRFPVQFLVNGYPALRVATTVVEPRAPLGLTAGITRIDGFRPTDDRYRVRMRLVLPPD